MNDQLLRFGGGGDTSVTLLAAVLVVLASLLIWTLPRQRILVPLFLAIFFIPLAQKVVISGLHFMMFRMLLICAWLRVFSKLGLRELTRLNLTAVDRAFIWWAAASTVTFILLWRESGAVIQRMGFLYDTLGFYFLFRILIRNREESDEVITVFAIVCGILAVCMLNEHLTGRNLFAVFGGVPAMTTIREGKLRAQGAFSHPITAGTFGATLAPLFLGLCWRRKYRWIGWIGVLSSTVVSITSNSSTPLMAYMAGIAALCFWPFRKFMRTFRWAASCVIISLHLIMKAPVWALIGRVDLTGGSSSSHRFELVDQSIRHIGDWWLVGTRTASSWGANMGDTSNLYVDQGVTGGLITLMLFVSIVVFCFKGLGKARKILSRQQSSRPEKQIWALGATLFSHVVAFLGIVYFDQIVVSWYVLVATISAITAATQVPRQADLKLSPTDCLTTPHTV